MRRTLRWWWRDYIGWSPSGKRHLDFRSNTVAIAGCAHQTNGQPVSRACRYVFQDPRWLVERGHHHVDQTIAVEIGKSGATVVRRVAERRSRLGGHILKSATCIVEDRARQRRGTAQQAF